MPVVPFLEMPVAILAAVLVPKISIGILLSPLMAPRSIHSSLTIKNQRKRRRAESEHDKMA